MVLHSLFTHTYIFFINKFIQSNIHGDTYKTKFEIQWSTTSSELIGALFKGSIILYIGRLRQSSIQMISLHTRIFNTNIHKKGKREGDRLEE